MRTKVCLVVIFNHRFDRNIEVLEKIYRDRFSAIYFLVPFYDGKKSNVIKVYESSFQFQGYLSQGLDRFFDESYTHYLFIGDDLILNPQITEENILQYFSITEDCSWISSIQPLGNMKHWHFLERIFNAVKASEDYSYHGTNYQNEILDADIAYSMVEKLGYHKEDFVIKKDHLFNHTLRKRDYISFPLQYPKEFIRLINDKLQLAYPFFGGYSDVFILHRKDIKKVCHSLGIFAAMGLFVEIAIPTAMRLDCEHLKSGDVNSMILWGGESINRLKNSYESDFNNLFSEWPENDVFIHPIKLSQWKYETKEEC